MRNQKTRQKDAAICFSGQVRKFELCYPYIKKNLLDNLGSYDIFCCAEDDSDFEKIKILNPVKTKKVRSSEVDKVIKPKIKFLNKHNYKSYILPQSPRFNFRNILQQLFKINGAYELLEDYTKEKKVSYKYFIRIRFDFLPLDKINPSNFKIKNMEVITPDINCIKPRTQINDMFCITRDQDTFKTYCSLYESFEDAVQKVGVDFSLKQKLYFSFEKKYSDFFFYIFNNPQQRGLKSAKKILGFFLLFPKKFYKEFKARNRCDTERTFFYHLTSAKNKIREEKIPFLIVRNSMEGLLMLGQSSKAPR